MARTLLASLVALSVSLLTGCSQDPAPTPTTLLPPATTPTTATTITPSEATTSTTAASRQGVLHVGTAVPLESVDPADAVTLPDWEIILAMSRGLLVEETGTGRLLPGVAAQEPEVSDDGLTYTFRLGSETRFSDGLELTAPLYVESLRRVMTVGGRASDLVANFVEGVEAPDDSTLVIRLRQPVAFFPVLLGTAAYVPVHPDIFPVDRLEPRPEAPIHGVGDWYIARISDEQVVLEPNPYAQTDAAMERVVIQQFTTHEEMGAAMAQGDLDLIWRGVGPEAEAMLAGVEDVTVTHAPGGLLQFLVINHDRPPTDDPLVRQALARAVDRRAVADQMLEGAVEPAFSPVPDGFLGASDSFLDVYGEPDTEAAIELLEEAGFTPAAPARLELAYPPERFGLHVARAMEELERQFEATGLIDVTLTAHAWNTYVGEVVSGTYNAALLGWGFDFPDPHNYLAPFVQQGGLGGSASGDAEMVQRMVMLLNQAAVASDPAERTALYAELQQLYAQDVVTLPLWVDLEAVAYWDHVVAEPEGPHREALNIGPTLRLDYGSLRLER